MKVSDAVAMYLHDKGLRTIFGYQGGSITHLIDSFDKYAISYVQCYNEQGAGLAADAYARMQGNAFGVAVATNGPGATNLVTAIANAYCDSVPVLFLTGQVHSFSMRKSNKVRQESFQEIDIISLTRTITKYCVTVTDKRKVIYEIDKAISIAISGRKGPVLIDLPVDIQGEDIDYNAEIHSDMSEDATGLLVVNHVKSILSYISKSRRPIILAGGGIQSARVTHQFRQFVHISGIPVVTSLMGLDAINHYDDCFVGLIGSYGNRFANIALQESDLIIVLGSRLDVRQSGKNRQIFAPNAEIMHIDIDETELGHFFEREIKIHCSLRELLPALIEKVEIGLLPDFSEWRTYVRSIKDKYPSRLEFDSEREFNPNELMNYLGENIPDNTVVTFDVGQNQMWSAQSLRINGDNIRILNSGGLGVMGYSLPAAIGAFYSRQMKHVVAIMGDGGLQMNLQEFQLVSQEKLPIKVFVIHNNSLGLIRDIHEKYYEQRYIGSVQGFSVPDLEILAKMYNMKYVKVIGIESIQGIKEILCDENPYLFDVVVPCNSHIRPELLGLNGLEAQYPYLEEKNGERA